MAERLREETETKREDETGDMKEVSEEAAEMMMQDDAGWCPPVYPDLPKVHCSTVGLV